MNKYNTHSDLAKESLDLLKEGKHYQRKIEKKEDFSMIFSNFTFRNV